MEGLLVELLQISVYRPKCSLILTLPTGSQYLITVFDGAFGFPCYLQSSPALLCFLSVMIILGLVNKVLQSNLFSSLQACQNGELYLQLGNKMILKSVYVSL